MTPLAQLVKNEDGWYIYESKLATLLQVTHLDKNTTELEPVVFDLISAFFIQWQQVLLCYQGIQVNLSHLNAKNDDGINFSEYDLASCNESTDLGQRAYFLIVTMKTFIDLLVTLLQYLESDSPNSIKQYTELSRFKSHNKQIDSQIEAIRKGLSATSFTRVGELRNKLVHRGYFIKPVFTFQKSEKFTIRISKAFGLNQNPEEIELCALFQSFIADVKEFDRSFEVILSDKMTLLIGIDSPLVKFTFGDQVSKLQMGP